MPPSQAKGSAERSVDGFHVRLRHGAQLALDHWALDRSDDARHHGREKQAGSPPVGDGVVAEEAPADIAGDGRHHNFLPRAVVGQGADHESRPEFLA